MGPVMDQTKITYVIKLSPAVLMVLWAFVAVMGYSAWVGGPSAYRSLTLSVPEDVDISLSEENGRNVDLDD